VPVCELPMNNVQQALDFRFRQRHHPHDNVARNFVSARPKRTKQNTRTVRSQSRTDPPGMEWGNLHLNNFLRETGLRTLFRKGFFEARDGVLQCLHFGERQEERERGFCALVLANTVDMQPIATSAGARVVDGKTQIVSS